MSDGFDFDDGVGGEDSAVEDPFADYQQPSSGFGFVDDEQQQQQRATLSEISSAGTPQKQHTPPSSPQLHGSGSSTSLPLVDDENSPLRDYQRKQQQMLAEREKKSQEEHDKVRAAARAEIDKFYEERRQKCDQAIRENRRAQETKKDEAAGTTGWARAVALLDLNTGRPEGKDVSRMRKILMEHGSLPLKKAQ